ncbi:hypothetical protein PK35_07295 [Tamlana nanhaiensis]|uniref:Tetratricopeptide repeat protein n=1 Tax=Neotamlana nanhaiensis TaxID=1382798 RepID=A0A0D7W3C7_9FLAO|nr:hypothetical protein [Tamlana nanhaiensis]KJD33630.1 hypothetical protein PK35_07295 [Tamlana nanhaiensis]
MKDSKIIIKPLFSITILFISFVVNSQDYAENFKGDICQCMQEKGVNLKTIDNVYEDCFNASLVSYASLIDSEFNDENVTVKFSKGQVKRRELKAQFKYELIYNCDIYFSTINRGIELVKEKARLTSDASQLQKQNEYVAMHPSYISYFQRAQLHYRLDDLENAKKDLFKSIELDYSGKNDKGARDQKLLLAQIYEDQKQFNKAIEIYDKLFLNVYDHKVGLLKAIAVKKSGGKYIPFSSETNKNSVATETENDQTSAVSRRVNNASSKNVTLPEQSSAKVREKSKDSVSKKKLRSLFKLDD